MKAILGIISSIFSLILALFAPLASLGTDQPTMVNTAGREGSTLLGSSDSGGTNNWIDYTDPARAAKFIGGEVETFATAQPQGLREELPEGGQCDVYGNCVFHFGDQVCAYRPLAHMAAVFCHGKVPAQFDKVKPTDMSNYGPPLGVQMRDDENFYATYHGLPDPSLRTVKANPNTFFQAGKIRCEIYGDNTMKCTNTNGGILFAGHGRTVLAGNFKD
ncbi:hypothetical protein P4N68_04605 [Corynebacterium felinum]|uniref:Secreted protein n=1 Tax=Corynebacterium felinum TaxID=131318 RepID=A0ABU2B751_9CORY|nr:hypothetical protein [Corynebacterium felinum]MDF5820365.1 hypothetical protein [Corynebacterium felinum]MDR7354437.1 hypothetical protein [Corynebacterium felinum]WJY93806.1 hypothetical protein CFELI_00755 [Corynebacterium felinum]